jgi:hypothetical protein
MINFNDLPGDIKSKIFKINKDREREEHWKLLMNQVRADAVERDAWRWSKLYSLGRDPCDVIFLIRQDSNLVHNDREYRTHWDWDGNVEIHWYDSYFGERWLDFLDND